ncbi:hypothetical protein P7L78_19165 [Tistrella bauzanensis]|uniref:hypothetical protein n=1 Tax=Tistrella TaxID=171436 RepID=UPI0031F6D91D
MKERDHSKNGITGLFEDQITWLWDRFPRFDKEGEEIVGWQAGAAAEYLIERAAKAGVVDPEGLRRGVGTWIDDDTGGIIVHCGDKVFRSGRFQGLGRYGGKIYTAKPRMPAPAKHPAAAVDVHRLRELFGRWSWRRPEIDPDLLIGLVASALMVGALDWRPSGWITGGAGSGKTTLQGLVDDIVGDWMLKLSSTSPAGVRDVLSGDARPVSLDEFEPAAQGDREAEVLTLVRIGSTRDAGGIARSSPDLKGRVISFQAQFLMSSILIPSMGDASWDRITVLELDPLTPDALAARREIEAAITSFRAFGPALHRRLIDRWGEFRGQFDAWRLALGSIGHSSRAADQLGTLLTVSSMLLYDQPPDEAVVAEALSHLQPAVLAEASDRADNPTRCIERLLTSPAGQWAGGSQLTVGELVHRAAFADPGEADPARQDLRRIGVDVVVIDGAKSLIVSTRHEGIARIYAGTQWRASPEGAGVWSQALGRLPGAKRGRTHRFKGVPPTKSVVIPLATLDIDT